MCEAGLAVHESEPHMSEYFDQAQTTQIESQDQEDMGMLPGTESRADLLFKSADGTKVIPVDVTSTSGISKHELFEAVESRAKLIFFGIEPQRRNTFASR
jgi:hypothetical protein